MSFKNKTLLIILAGVALITSCTKTTSSINNETSFTLDRNNLNGTITNGTVVLESGTYKLTGPLSVASGATLKIKPGVIIESQGNGAEGFIAIQQGGLIDAQGTAAQPIIFTSVTKSSGSWGGIVLCGNAPINKGTTAQAEITGYTYGGADVADNSGTMKYCIIEYSGNKISGTKEFNGVSFFGVGNGTIIEYVRVTNCSDDAFEFFGGTVAPKYLLAFNVEDDLFDWTEGWSGGITNGYGDFGNSIASDDSRGIEADNLETNFAASPIANPTLTNITLLGRIAPPAAGAQKEGLKLRRGTYGILNNVYAANFAKGVNIESDECLAANANGKLQLYNINIVGATSKFTGTKTNGTAMNDIKYKASSTTYGAGKTLPAWAF